MRNGVVWVVMNHNITYKRPAKLGDTLKIHTHIADYRGAISNRVVEMRHADTDKILVHSKTQWCLLNAKTAKPKRISAEIKNRFSKS
jgi:acyl-CoA thioester hydrolase